MLAHFFIKTSFLAFYLRLTVDERYRFACWTLLGINSCICISSAMASAFSCKPVSYYWNKNQKGRCINLTTLYFGNGILNTTMDFAILVLPILMIWRNSSLEFNKKISVSVLFLLGGLTCVYSVARLPVIWRLTWSDVTMSIIPADGWSTIEMNIAVMTSCIPAIKPLFLLLIDKIRFICGFNSRHASIIPNSIGNYDQHAHDAGNPLDSNTVINWNEAFDEITTMHELSQETNDQGLEAVTHPLDARIQLGIRR